MAVRDNGKIFKNVQVPPEVYDEFRVAAYVYFKGNIASISLAAEKAFKMFTEMVNSTIKDNTE